MDTVPDDRKTFQISLGLIRKGQYLFRRIRNFSKRRFNLWQFNAIWNAYVSPKKWVRRWILPAIQTIQRFGKLIFNENKLSVVILNGNAVPSQCSIKVVYIGRKRSLNYFVFSLFGDNPVDRREFEKISSRTSRKIGEGLASTADLVIFERNCLVKWKPNWGEWIETPFQVRHVFEIDAQDTWQSIENQFTEQKRYIRKAQKEEFSISISQDKKDFDYFYDRMLIPLAKKRYKDRARIAQRLYLQALLPKGFITFVSTPDGQRIAGAFNIIDGDIYLGMVMGVLDGNEDWIQRGAIALLYHSDIQYCHKKGLHRIDVGESVPFANNGLFRYKAMWGYRPQLDPWNYINWLIWVPNNSPEGLRWVVRHQCLPQFSKFSSTYIQQISTNG